MDVKADNVPVARRRSDGGELIGDPGYGELLAEIKRRIAEARTRAASAVNTELIRLYWSIGHDILARQDQEGWGAKVIEQLARDLKEEGHRGFSVRNLKYMRAFAKAWPDESFVQQPIAQIPWGHNIDLLDKLDDAQTRLWYARQAFEQGWSRNVLQHQIASALHARQGRALTNFDRTLPSPDSELAQELIKDPYDLGFVQGERVAVEQELPSVPQLTAGLQRIVDERAEEIEAALEASDE